ncbi:MAG: thiolase family protein [Planctomycetes bacterium]|nr:thiolase family protein [Planctomycetota bacterium]
MNERIALIGGLRTPFAKAGGPLAGWQADDLGAFAARELLARTRFPADRLDELIAGNVAQPIQAANVARIIALKAGLPETLIASTVHRNCASGMEAVTVAATKIRAGEADAILCVGAESMSNIPLIVNAEMTALFGRVARAKTAWARIAPWLGLRPRHLMPVIGVQLGLTDPVCGLNMGQTAEVLAREFAVSRDEQDAFALQSHRLACAARTRLGEEIVPIPLPGGAGMLAQDDGPRDGQDAAALAKLRPYFDKAAGTVTVGNACPLTDGAAATIVCRESLAASLGLPVLGWLSGWAYAALDGRRMGLGPVHATAKLLARSGGRLQDFDLVELNEAFAAQALACLRAFASPDYGARLGLDRELGRIDPLRLNVNGGAIALGHPVGATGLRLVVTILRELARRGQRRGLATLCIGGGQGAALALEAP